MAIKDWLTKKAKEPTTSAGLVGAVVSILAMVGVAVPAAWVGAATATIAVLASIWLIVVNEEKKS